jgi:ankyrin repeat protein
MGYFSLATHFCPKMISSPTIYSLAINHNYDEIVDFLEKKDINSLEWIDFHGNTALHILCRHDCMNLGAIEAVLLKRPNMAGIYNHSGWTPLHLACQKHSQASASELDSIRLALIQACPSAVSSRRESGYIRETPFDLACQSQAGLSVLEAMLSIDPTLAFPRKETLAMNRSPLQVLWNHGLKEHVASVLLTTLFQQLVDDRSSFLLHAACLRRIPRACFETILKENLNQVMIKDPGGNLPLHYASSQKNSAALPYTETIISLLLQAAPNSANVLNSERRLPLHNALDHPHLTWERGLSKLSKDNLLVRDPRTGLYPAQMAAVHANQSRVHLTTLFSMICAAPEVVQLR